MKEHPPPKRTLTDIVHQEYLTNTPDMVFVKTMDGVYVDASAPFAAATVCTRREDVAGKTDFELFEDKELARRYVDDDARLLEKGEAIKNYVEPFTVAGGKPRYCLTSKYILRDEAGKPVGILGISRDVTREYEARQSFENELRSLFELPQDALSAALLDITAWRVIDARHRQGAARVVSRYDTIDEYVAGARRQIVEDRDALAFYAGFTQPFLIQEHAYGRRTRSLEYLRRTPGGAEIWVRDELRFLTDPVNGNLLLIVLQRDIGQERSGPDGAGGEQLDEMTGLLRRDAFIRGVRAFLAGEGANGRHALLMIDMDNFKQVNDRLGHQQGDAALADAAAALRSCFRADDILGRLGGDEFMALMVNTKSAREVRRKAGEVISALQFTIRDKDEDLDITSSVGVTVFQAGEKDFRALYYEADRALSHAKREGKTRYALYESSREDAAAPVLPGSVGTVHLKTLLEYMDGGVLLAEVSDDIHITYVSPSLHTAFFNDVTPSGSVTDRIFGRVLPADLPGLRAALFDTAHSNRLLDHTYRVTLGEGVIEWRHIRAKRLPEDADGTHKLVAVITDISELKLADERLRQAELRYRTAIEQTSAMLWEVDLPARTLYLTGSAWKAYGFSGTVYPDAPESFLRVGAVHPDSVDSFRKMFDDLYAGCAGEGYYFRMYDQQGGETWVRDQISFLRNEDGAPVSALAVMQPVPNINAEMRRFEQEKRFASVVRGSLLGYVRVNITLDRLEYANINGDERCDGLSGMPYTLYQAQTSGQFIAPEDIGSFRAVIAPERMLERFNAGESWLFTDYRRIGPDGSRRWVSIFIKLMRHPISGDVYAFAYLRDNQRRRAWELALPAPPQRDLAMLLYTQDTLAALSKQMFATSDPQSLVSMSVIEFTGLDDIKRGKGAAETAETYFTIGRLCRIVIDGDVVIGRMDDGRVAMLRVNAISVEKQRERITSTLTLLRQLLWQVRPDAGVDMFGGFAVERAGSASCDTLLRKAAIACSSVSKTLGESTVAFDDGAPEPLGEADTGDLAAKYRALEIRFQQQANILRVNENDELTGLPDRRAFYRRVREILRENPDAGYVIVRLDVNRFKIYNDVCGTAAGDKLLRDIADWLRAPAGSAGLASRLESDHFAVFIPESLFDAARLEKDLDAWLGAYSPAFRLTATVGVYRITDPSVDVSLMCDRALIAMRSVKSGFDTKVAYYDDKLRDRMLLEQRLVDDMPAALREGQFEVYYQPQVNYESGAIIGAEALVRWNHPELGLLLPGAFIPLFEQNGLITRLDEYVVGRCCRNMRAWLDAYPAARTIAIAVNISRQDLYGSDLRGLLLSILEKYGLPPGMLKLEITESAYMENPQQLIGTVRELQNAGFIVEMDDFGSGYSSLNTLKDVPVDILKLDMRFLAACADSARAGNILGSVIRMAHWLRLPLIAEGVETGEQAEYLKSLGCIYMQGYYFNRPLTAHAFEELLGEGETASPNRYAAVSLEGAAAFWDPSAQMTLLFNSYVGGAAIMEYRNGKLELVRANDNFYKTLGTTREKYRQAQGNVLERFDDANRRKMVAELEKAISTGQEAGCEVLSLPTAGVTRPWTNNKMRLLARNSDCALMYISVEDITDRKRMEIEREAENERSRLLMNTPGACICDYDCASDAMTYQAYIPGRGLVSIDVPSFSAALRTVSILDAQAKDIIGDILKRLKDAPASGECEFRANIWRTGMRWCHLRYVCVADDTGRAVRVVGQVEDIQRFKESEALRSALGGSAQAATPVPAYNDVLVSQVFNLFYGTSDVVSAIDTTLSLLGRHFDLSRVYVFEDIREHAACSNTFEWCAPGVTPEKDNLAHVDYDDIGGREAYVGLFDQTGMFYCRDVPSLQSPSRDLLLSQGIQALLQCALMDEGVFSGFVGFDECRGNRAWNDEQVGTLMFISRIIGAFLLKLRSAAFSADFRAALEDNAAFVYIIEPDTHKVIYTNRAIREHAGRDCVGVLCHTEFAGEDAPCPQCPMPHMHKREGRHIAQVLRPDGMLMLTLASPLRWNGREMALITSIDITKTRQAERALFAEKQKIDTALAATGLLLWTYDMADDSFMVASAGQLAEGLDEYVPGAYKTMLRQGLVAPGSVEDYIALHEKLKHGEKSASAIICFSHAPGTAQWMKITYTCMPIAPGQPPIAIAIGQDVTAQKLAEERFAQEMAYRKSLGSDCLRTMRINVTREIVEDIQGATGGLSTAPGVARDDLVPTQALRIPDAEERARYTAFFATQNLLNAFARGEHELELQYRAISPDGNILHVHTEVKLSRRPTDGDIIAFVAIRDRTPEMLAQTIMRTLIDTSYDYVASINAVNGHFRLFASKTAAGSLLPARGTDFTKAAGEMVRSYVSKADMRRVIEETSLPYVVGRLESQPEHVCVYRSSDETGGRTRQLVFRAIGEDKRHLLLTRQDVTELVEAERLNTERLTRALSQAREASAAKSDFLSRMSHDIRTPLNAILGLTSLAAGRDDLTEETAAYLRMIDASGQYLKQLISDMLDMSAIERRVVHLKPERYSHAEFIGVLKSTFQPLCDIKGIKLLFREGPYKATLMADKVRVNQIFFNVLSNAVKFTEPGGVITYAEENSHVRDGMLSVDYVISDTGCGMDEAFIAHAFEPFAKERRASGEADGVGLGLSIAKSIVELMDGDISIQSAKGKGTAVRVSLSLPLAIGQGLPQDKAPYDSATALQGAAILMAEDIPVNAMIVQKLLERAGAAMDCASDGAMAVQMFAASPVGHYDAVLMDIFMPVMDGLEATKRIRALDRPDARDVPIIALSANAFEKDRELSRQAGLNEHLSKPLDPAVLIRTLYALIRGRRGKS